MSRTIAVSSFAAEFSALSEPEFAGLRDFLAHNARLPFIYLSVHAPVKQREAPEDELVEWLEALPPKVESIIVHPDTLTMIELYKHVGRRLVIENMDERKPDGRTVEELSSAFAQLPDAGFCLDVAHAWSVDPTMRLAHALLDHFGERLREVHLSSLEDGRHVPVKPEHEPLFVPVLERCTDVPWILEAAMPERWLHDPVELGTNGDSNGSANAVA